VKTPRFFSFFLFGVFTLRASQSGHSGCVAACST
jgi:hypothetical protein